MFPTISLQHPQQLLAKRSPRNRPKKRYALIPGNGTPGLFNSPRWPLRTDRATCFLLHRDHNVIRRHRASNFNPSARLKHYFLDRGNNKSRNNNASSCKRGVTEITWGIRSNELWLHHRDFYPPSRSPGAFNSLVDRRSRYRNIPLFAIISDTILRILGWFVCFVSNSQRKKNCGN